MAASASHDPSASQRALDRVRSGVYARLMTAENDIAEQRYAHGVSDATVEAALDAADTGPTAAQRQEDLYVSSLSHYVRALGGRLEVHAVFPEGSVVIDPDGP